MAAINGDEVLSGSIFILDGLCIGLDNLSNWQYHYRNKKMFAAWNQFNGIMEPITCPSVRLCSIDLMMFNLSTIYSYSCEHSLSSTDGWRLTCIYFSLFFAHVFFFLVVAFNVTHGTPFVDECQVRVIPLRDIE